MGRREETENKLFDLIQEVSSLEETKSNPEMISALAELLTAINNY